MESRLKRQKAAKAQKEEEIEIDGYQDAIIAIIDADLEDLFAELELQDWIFDHYASTIQ